MASGTLAGGAALEVPAVASLRGLHGMTVKSSSTASLDMTTAASVLT